MAACPLGCLVEKTRVSKPVDSMAAFVDDLMRKAIADEI